MLDFLEAVWTNLPVILLMCGLLVFFGFFSDEDRGDLFSNKGKSVEAGKNLLLGTALLATFLMGGVLLIFAGGYLLWLVIGD